MIRRNVSLLLILALAVSGTACFGLFGGGDPETSATIVVYNDVAPPAPLTVTLRRVGDDAENLGTVSPGQERTLTHSSSELQGTYQLVAIQSSGAAVTSREFTLFAGARVQWQISTNSVNVTQPR